MTAVTLQPVSKNDDAFLYQLYVSTRVEEMALTGWPPQQQEVFLRNQFHAQRTYYDQEYPNASFAVILLDEEPIGRLYVDRRTHEIRLVDIALLPQYRSQGIGSRLIQNLLSEGESTDRSVSLHVEKNNLSAIRFYEKLGFTPAGDTGTHLFMEGLAAK